MTRKEKITKILDKYWIRRGWIESDESMVEARPLTAKEELADAILALPIEVPSYEEIESYLSNDILNNILGLDNPYPLHIVLEKLKWATNYLLHKKNYDGHGYEELNQCVRRAEEIISCLKELNFNHISIKSFLIWLEKEGGSPFTDKDALIDCYLRGIKNKK